MKTKQAILTIITMVGLILTSCYWNNWDKLHPASSGGGTTVTCDTSAVVSYSATIQPIIVNNCATTSACHVSRGTAPTNYTIFSVVKTDAQTGIGFPNPTIMQRIDLPTSNVYHMPKSLGFLAPCDTMKIRKWIYAGCPNN